MSTSLTYNQYITKHKLLSNKILNLLVILDYDNMHQLNELMKEEIELSKSNHEHYLKYNKSSKNIENLYYKIVFAIEDVTQYFANIDKKYNTKK